MKPASDDFIQAIALVSKAYRCRQSAAMFYRARRIDDGDELTLEADMMNFQAVGLAMGAAYGALPAQL